MFRIYDYVLYDRNEYQQTLVSIARRMPLSRKELMAFYTKPARGDGLKFVSVFPPLYIAVDIVMSPGRAFGYPQDE